MADLRALDAIRRIERALARIESAANGPSPSQPPEDYERLREAHGTLRRSVAGAIGEIDRILETEGAR